MLLLKVLNSCILRILSHGYDKYDWVSALYFKANRSRGIVAYKAHLREVSGSVAYNEIQLEVTQMLAAQAEAEREPVIEEEEYVPGRKLDDKKCFAILDEWYQKYRFVKAKDRTLRWLTNLMKPSSKLSNS